MGAAEIAGAIIFFITVSGTLWGIWWRIEGKVTEARADALQRAEAAAALAAMARQEVTELRLHSAEHYATKDGMQRQTDSLLRAIESVGNRIDGLNERLDRAFEARSTTRTRS